MAFCSTASNATRPICYHDSSSEYTTLWTAFSKKTSVTDAERDEFFFRVHDFAVKGEIAAVDTLMSTFTEDPVNQKGVLVPLLVENPENMYAKLRLALLLNDRYDSRCLQMYDELATSNIALRDTDFWPNYTAALLKLAPRTEDTLRKCWELLKKWPFNPSDDSDMAALFYNYFDIATRARNQKLAGFLRSLVSWDAQTQQNSDISAALFIALEGTPYMQAKVKPDASRFPDRATLEKQLEQTYVMSKKNAEKLDLQEETIVNAERIITTNLRHLLEKEEISLIPCEGEHQHHFVKFDYNKPSLDHLRRWAQIIVKTHRAELIASETQDYDSLNYFAILDEKKLRKICINHLHRIYALLEEVD